MTKARELAELGKAVSVHDNRLDFDRAVVIPGLIDAAGTTTIANGSVTTAKIADDAVTSAKVDTNITVAGTLDVTGDLSVTQYIRHVGDTDTHLRFAGANDLRIVSGNVEHAAFDGTIVFNQSGADMDLRVESNNNANMLFVDAGNDRVGVGTNSPERAFHVYSTEIVQAMIETNGSSARLAFKSSGSGSNAHNLIAVDTNDMFFRTNNSERMRITSAGKVGIGGTPSVPLHIQASGQDAQVRIQSLTNGYATRLQLYANNVSGASYNAIQSHVNGDSTVQWEISGPRASAEDQMLFLTGGSERMRINSSGNVGIGTSSPDDELDVEGADPAIRLTDTSASGYARLFANNGSLILQADEGNSVNNSIIGFDVDGTERMRINSSGRVGIGTNSPTQQFSLGFADLGSGAIEFRTATYAQMAKIVGSHDSGTAEGSMRFHTRTGGNEPERMRITPAGNVGIGTTAPAEPLDVQGSDNGIIVRSAQAARPKLTLINGTTTMFTISANGTYASIGDGTDINRYVYFQDGISRHTKLKPDKYEPMYGPTTITGGFVNGASTGTYHSITNINVSNYAGGYASGAKGIHGEIFWTSGNVGKGYNHTVRFMLPPNSSNTATAYSSGNFSSFNQGSTVGDTIPIVVTHHTSMTSNHDIRLRLHNSTNGNYDPLRLEIYADTSPNAAGAKLTIWRG